MMDGISEESPLVVKKAPPVPPPLPCTVTTNYHEKGLVIAGTAVKGCSCVNTATKDLWEALFDGGYRSDVCIRTDNGGIIYAHASILGMASPVMKSMLKQKKVHGRWRAISIRGVPQEAVRIFIRFLYSSCFEEEEMQEFVMHLLVLSHAFVIPHLKRMCERKLEKGMVTIENVVDIFQLALLCDAARLGLICHRLILRNFRAVSATEGWEVMKKSHPILEKLLLESLMESDNPDSDKANEWARHMGKKYARKHGAPMKEPGSIPHLEVGESHLNVASNRRRDPIIY